MVHLVDDDPSFLRSMSRLLRAAGFRVAAYQTPQAFMEQLTRESAGCVITDLCMPRMDGIALQEEIRKTRPGLPVVFLTGRGDIPTSVQAMRGGADDFLTKCAPKEALIAAVRRALALDERNRAEQARLEERRQPFAALTGREREVLSHVVQGKPNKQIAADMGLHERTVKLHRTHIAAKLDVQSVAELMHLAHEAGVLNLDGSAKLDFSTALRPPQRPA
jgi:FixJ family two-component response regulator